MQVVLMKILIILMSTWYVEGMFDADAFCDLQCTDGSTNSICEYRCEIGSGCNNLTVVEMMDKTRQLVLDLHNHMRFSVASGAEHRVDNKGASNMMVLNYDMDLEVVAECWAKACRWEHDACRATKMFIDVAQNLYQITSMLPLDGFDDEHITSAIIDWYDEVAAVTEPILRSYRSDMDYDQFTQVVWAKTTHVGCGRTFFIENNQYVIYFVCNYGPAGNIEGEPVYEFGEGATNCPSGTEPNSEYKALCGELIILSEHRTKVAFRGSATIASISYSILSLPLLIFLRAH